MTTFLMFGKYSQAALEGISAKRTKQAAAIIKKFRGQITAMYVLLGQQDLVLIVNLPGLEQAVKASIALSKATGISFTTSPATKVEEFDKLIAKA